MSKFEDGSYGSLAGVTLLGKVLAGRCGMRYTRAAVGNGTIPDGETPKTMSGPAGYVMDAQISGVTNPVDGECQVTVQIKSDNVETGFYCTGIVLYAEDPDEGEVPYTYLCLENEPEWIRPASSIVGKLATFDLIAAVGDVDLVVANIDPDSIVTYSMAEQLIAQAMQQMDVSVPADAWHEAEGGGYAARMEIPDFTVKTVPLVAVYPTSETAAKDCGLKSVCESFDGGVIFYAYELPTAVIDLSLLLLRSAKAPVSGGAPIGGDYVLPAATATRLGGVKVGDGVDVQLDGTISVGGPALIEEVSAPEENVEEMLNDVFGETPTE